MSHPTIYLAYKHEKNKERRFGYFYVRPHSDVSFSIRFLTTEPFGVIKNDERFRESVQDIYQNDTLKNFCWKTYKTENIVDNHEPRDAKIYCTNHFKQQFPELYETAHVQLQNIGAESKGIIIICNNKK